MSSDEMGNDAISISTGIESKEQMPLIKLPNDYTEFEAFNKGARNQRDADWQWHLAAIKQFAEKCIEGMPKVHAACTCGQSQYDACIAHIRAMAEKGESHE